MPFRQKDYDFNSYSAGNKVYGAGRSNPHMGGGLDPMGYRERDLAHKAKRNALLRRMKAHNSQKYMTPEWLGGQNA